MAVAMHGPEGAYKDRLPTHEDQTRVGRWCVFFFNSPNDELRQQSSLIGYLYAVLDQHAVVLAKTNEALAGHMKGAAVTRRRLATERKQNEIMREHLDGSQKETERLQQLDVGVDEDGLRAGHGRIVSKSVYIDKYQYAAIGCAASRERSP